MVVPGWNALSDLDSDATQDEEHGQIKSNYDLIKKLYYDEDLDSNDDDPYLTLEIQRRMQQTKRRDFMEQGKKIHLVITRYVKNESPYLPLFSSHKEKKDGSRQEGKNKINCLQG
jgi:hypothetical protein